MLLWAFATAGDRRGGARRGRPARRRRTLRAPAVAAGAGARGAPRGAPGGAARAPRRASRCPPLDVALSAALAGAVLPAGSGRVSARPPSSTTRSRITCTCPRPGCTIAASTIVPAVFGDPSPAYAPVEPGALVPVPDGAASLRLPRRRRAAPVRGAGRRWRSSPAVREAGGRRTAALGRGAGLPADSRGLGADADRDDGPRRSRRSCSRRCRSRFACWNARRRAGPTCSRSATAHRAWPSGRSTRRPAGAAVRGRRARVGAGAAPRSICAAARSALAAVAGDGRVLVRAQRRSSPATPSTRSRRSGCSPGALRPRGDARLGLPPARRRRSARSARCCSAAGIGFVLARGRRRSASGARLARLERRRLRCWRSLVRSSGSSIPYQESRFLFAAVRRRGGGARTGRRRARAGVDAARLAPGGRARRSLIEWPTPERLLLVPVGRARRRRGVALAAPPARLRRRSDRAAASRLAALAVAASRCDRRADVTARRDPGYSVGDELDAAWALVPRQRARRPRRLHGHEPRLPARRRAAREPRSLRERRGQRPAIACTTSADRPATATAEPAPYRRGASPDVWLAQPAGGAREVLFVAALYPVVAPQHRRRRRRLPGRARLGRRPPRHLPPALRLADARASTR